MISYILLCICLWGTLEAMKLPENALRKQIFNDYDPEVFPQPINGKPLGINISVAIRDIPELVLTEHRLTFDIVISLTWINHQLKWNPASYPNVSGISTATHKVWTPELLLLPERLQLNFGPTQEKVFLKPNGVTRWIFQRKVDKECTFNLEDFPRDRHTCSMSIHTDIPGHLVLLRKVPSHVQDFKKNGAWTITGISRNVGRDASHNEQYAYNIAITLQRHSPYYKRKLVNPLIIMSLLPLIGTLCPFDSGEKIGFAITSLLAFLVALQYTMEKLPESEKSPEIVKAAESTLVLMVVHVFLSCIAVWIATRKSEPPKWLVKIFNKKIMAACYLGKPYEIDSCCSSTRLTSKWVWRKFAHVINIASFIVFFIVWASLLIPEFVDKK